MRALIAFLYMLVVQPIFADEANRLIILAAAARARDEIVEPAPVVPAAEKPSLAWQPYAEIKKSGLGGFVYLWDDNCRNCVKAERDVFTDSRVIAKINEFPVYAKVKWTAEWGKSVPSVPSLVLVDSDNKIVAVEACPVDPDEFLDLFKGE